VHTWVPWTIASLGLTFGVLGACIPGFPGAIVALLGVAAFAALTGFSIVTADALRLAALLALAGGVAQRLAPIWGSRASADASGAATGAAAGATLGLISPLPLGAIVFGTIGSALGAPFGPARLVARVAALGGLVATALIAVLVDLLAVLGIGAVLAVAVYRAG
jgi:hypothetical protein